MSPPLILLAFLMVHLGGKYNDLFKYNCFHFSRNLDSVAAEEKESEQDLSNGESEEEPLVKTRVHQVEYLI